MRSKIAAGLALGLAVAAGGADAQTPPAQKPVVKTTPKDAAKPTPASKPKPKRVPRPVTQDGGSPGDIAVSVEGDYSGVSPESQPAKGPLKRHRPHTVSWVGFQLAGGAPRVFLQTTSAPSYTQSLAGDELLVKLPGFSLDTRNDARPLETQYFRTDVLEVAAKNAGGGVEVRVRFKKGTGRQGQARVEDAHGTSMLVLDFGGGQSPAAGG